MATKKKTNNLPNDKELEDGETAEVENEDEELEENPPVSEKMFKQSDVDKAIERAVKKALKDKDKEVEDAKKAAELSETERLKAENDALKKQGLVSKAKEKVIKALTSAGAKSAELLFKLKQNELEFDEKGKITNLDDILDELKEDYSEQFGVEKPDASINAGEGNKETPSVLTQADIDKMSQDELIANMDKVDAFLASQKTT